MTILLGFGFCPVACVTNSLYNNHQWASGKYKSAIHYPQERDSIILRHSQSSGGPDFQWRAQSSCNYTWAVLHTEILDKSLSITSHFTPIAPQTCLTVSSPEAAGPLHPSGDGCAVHVHVVFLEMAHPGQKQTSGHTGWCDGLGKERKHLGLSFSIFSTKHSLRPICWSKLHRSPQTRINYIFTEYSGLIFQQVTVWREHLMDIKIPLILNEWFTKVEICCEFSCFFSSWAFNK